MGGYKPGWVFNFDQVPFSVYRMFKKQNCSKGAKYNKLRRLASTLDLEKNFCTLMPVITADAFKSRNRAIPIIIIFKGQGKLTEKKLKQLNRVKGVEIWFSPKGTFCQRIVRKLISFLERWSFDNEGMTRETPKLFLADNLSCQNSDSQAGKVLTNGLKTAVNGKLINGVPRGTQYWQPVDRNVGETLKKNTVNDF